MGAAGVMIRGVSSGRIALALIIVLVFAVVAYIVASPGAGTGGPQNVQSTTNPTGSTSTTGFVEQSQTSSQSGQASNLITEGGMSGSGKPGGSFGAPLNSSTQAEITWSAPGLVDIYVRNSTGVLVFSKSASSGNYTFCVPATGTYTAKMQASGSQTGQWSAYLYEIRRSTC